MDVALWLRCFRQSLYVASCGDKGCFITVDGEWSKLVVPDSETAESTVISAKFGDSDVPVEMASVGELDACDCPVNFAKPHDSFFKNQQ